MVRVTIYIVWPLHCELTCELIIYCKYDLHTLVIKIHLGLAVLVKTTHLTSSGKEFTIRRELYKIHRRGCAADREI